MSTLVDGHGLAIVGLAVAIACATGCQTILVTEIDRSRAPSAIDSEVYRRAESDRSARLARQVERLRADLHQAEEALVTAESGLVGTHSRADAVSSLAEVRIQVERAAASAPWRPSELTEARSKLDEAARQVAEGHFGAALFFVYRAARIADTIEAEAARVYANANARYVRGRKVNLRAGASTGDAVVGVLSEGMPVFPEARDGVWVLVRTATGDVGWVHESLLEAN